MQQILRREQMADKNGDKKDSLEYGNHVLTIKETDAKRISE